MLSPVLQPRLMYALSVDGLLPPIFREVNEEGNLRKGVLFSGAFMTLMSAFVPFSYLDDFVSAGILIAFSVTNTSLVLLRHEAPEDKPFLLEKLPAFTNLLSFATALIACHAFDSPTGMSLVLCFSVTIILLSVYMSRSCPRTTFGGKRAISNDTTRYFKTPLLPHIPVLGNFANWYLVAQLSFLGIFLLLLYVCLATWIYFLYGARNSVGSISSWERGAYSVPSEVEVREIHDNHICHESEGHRETPGSKFASEQRDP